MGFFGKEKNREIIPALNSLIGVFTNISRFIACIQDFCSICSFYLNARHLLGFSLKVSA